jgi:Amt family ammonium transporter
VGLARLAEAQKPCTLGMITDACSQPGGDYTGVGYITPAGAIAIGIGRLIPWLVVTYIKGSLGYDDSLDAFGVHGIGGMWGAIATGLFATKSVNPAGANGLFYGNPALLWIQIKAVLITVVFSFVVGFVLLKLVEAFMGLRVSEHEERVGLDLPCIARPRTP